MRNILIIGFLSVFLVGCRKSNINDYRDYVGIWNNTTGNVTYKFEVKSNGKSFYEKVTTSGNKTTTIGYNGKFYMEGMTLKIGLKKMTINKAPELSNSIWVFTMDNIEYSGK